MKNKRFFKQSEKLILQLSMLIAIRVFMNFSVDLSEISPETSSITAQI